MILDVSKFEHINEVKNQIKMIEGEFCEGVKLWGKIDERFNGDKLSSFLLGKEMNAKLNITKLINVEGIFVTNSKTIETQFLDYYTKMFKVQECNYQIQKFFFTIIK